jgi:thymidylate synthase (FAD)
MESARQAYVKLVRGLERKFESEADPTLRRKLARQAARSVLPNATETKIFVSANGRAWRHFIEMRANEHAETEIRSVAVKICEILRKESPNIFGDYKLIELPDGTRIAETAYRKV